MRRRALDLTLLLAPLAFALAAPPAHAYAWMIKHGYSACATCHADPSGGGLLTAYGRAQSDVLLSTRWGAGSAEASPSANFLWNALQLPESLLLGASFRALAMAQTVDGGPSNTSVVLMQADAMGELRLGHLRVDGSIGVTTNDQSPASVAGKVISREHWVGWAFGEDDAFLARLGRINVPYGLRSIEHPLWVRQATRTDINDTQEHGVALAYSGEKVRAEVMAILGNYQVNEPFRERGYSGTFELSLSQHAAVGLTSLVTHASQDIYTQVATTRQAHGLFARASPWAPLVLMAEASFLVTAADFSPTRTGLTTMLQADVEPLQGVHLIATGETLDRGQLGVSYGGWLAVAWFFTPHADVRFDFMDRSADQDFVLMPPGRYSVLAYMGQAHVTF